MWTHAGVDEKGSGSGLPVAWGDFHIFETLVSWSGILGDFQVLFVEGI